MRYNKDNIGCGWFILAIILTFALSWIATCGLFALLVWALHIFGVFTIGTFVVKFSWLYATAFWIVCIIIRNLFKGSANVNK